MSEVSTPVEVFCSYAHDDEGWLRKLETPLRLLQQQGLLALWHDRLIVPGTNWARAIDTHLESASVIVLLVSAAFVASDYCSGIELKRALERQEEGSALVIPILVGEVNWGETPLMHLQALPTDARPLSLWSDEEVALADVAAGLRRAIEELPLLAANVPRATLPPIWNVPYPRNPFFLGRETDLALVHRRLHTEQAPALPSPQAISGLGGIGKTQFVLEFAYRYHQDYQAVLWARAESREALVSSYVAFASLLRLPESEDREQDLMVQAVKTWFQLHRGWLLILDNADELTLLREFLPPSLGGHLLLTTRAAVTGRLAQRLECETLTPEQGALLLVRRAALVAPDAALSQASSQEQNLAIQISRELGGLPLALDQAGAYLEETGTAMDSYWQLYQRHRADLLQQRGGLVAYHPAPVATTWSLSFQRVEEKNPIAADLLRLCAFLSPDAIAEEILNAGASLPDAVLAPLTDDAFQLNQVIESLRAYSLVRRNPKGKTLSMHRLVQVVIQDSLKESERRAWIEQAVLTVNAAFPHADYGMWPECECLLSHALWLARFIGTEQIVSEEAGRLLYEAASYLADRARYQEAEPLFLHALHIREHLFGPEHPQVATTLHYLAVLYDEQERYGEAEVLFLRSLHIREYQLGPEHLEVATSLNNLASLYFLQGRYSETEPLYQRALRIKEQGLGPEHPRVATTIHNLAVVYAEQGRYAEAEPLYQRALHISERLGPENPDVIMTLHNLAELYRIQGKDAEAEPLFRRVLQMREQQLGPDHPYVSYPLIGLADLYREQGRYEEAEPLYLRALCIREQSLGSEHPEVTYVLNGQADLYRQWGRYEEAESLYLRALRIREQQEGIPHPETADTMHGPAQLRQAQGNSEEARSWYTRALAVCEQTLGGHHPKTAEIRSHLKTFLHTIGWREEAPQSEL